jgi:hypothetical protein
VVGGVELLLCRPVLMQESSLHHPSGAFSKAFRCLKNPHEVEGVILVVVKVVSCPSVSGAEDQNVCLVISRPSPRL